MSRVPDGQVGRVLRRWIGVAVPKLLGEGMEGAVYEIDESSVAKLWLSRSAEGLRRRAAVYDALAAKALSFSVPRIVQVETVQGWAVTVERRLRSASELVVDRHYRSARADRATTCQVGK